MSGEDPDLYPNVDWVNSIFKNLSNNTRANVNVSGGTSSVKYYISGGFYNENGLFKTDPTADYNTGIYYRRFNFRANVDVKLTRHTSMNVNLATTFEQKNESRNEQQLDLVGRAEDTVCDLSDGLFGRPLSRTGY